MILRALANIKKLIKNDNLDNINYADDIAKTIRKKPPLISIIVLNWNRFELLKTTVLSLLANTTCPFQLILIDNNSSDFSQTWLSILKKFHPEIELIILSENQGGGAINHGFTRIKGEFVLISENDLEYLPNWDINLLVPFFIFANLGQLSPMSPTPQTELGEVWTIKPYSQITKRNYALNLAQSNVGTTSMIRREIVEKGIKWANLPDNQFDFKFPADSLFSQHIKDMGYLVAWSNQYQCINWGHNKNITVNNPDYYQANWRAKSTLAIDGLESLKDMEEITQAKSLPAENLILKNELANALQKIDNLTKQLLAFKSKYPKEDFSCRLTTKTTLFIDSGNDFSANETLQVDLDINDPIFDINFDLSESKNIKRLRWDPLEGFRINVNIKTIRILTKEGDYLYDLKQLKSNSTNHEKKWWLFQTLDPMFILENIPENISKISIIGKFEFA